MAIRVAGHAGTAPDRSPSGRCEGAADEDRDAQIRTVSGPGPGGFAASSGGDQKHRAGGQRCSTAANPSGRGPPAIGSVGDQGRRKPANRAGYRPADRGKPGTIIEAVPTSRGCTTVRTKGRRRRQRPLHCGTRWTTRCGPLVTTTPPARRADLQPDAEGAHQLPLLTGEGGQGGDLQDDGAERPNSISRGQRAERKPADTGSRPQHGRRGHPGRGHQDQRQQQRATTPPRRPTHGRPTLGRQGGPSPVWVEKLGVAKAAARR